MFSPLPTTVNPHQRAALSPPASSPACRVTASIPFTPTNAQAPHGQATANYTERAALQNEERRGMQGTTSRLRTPSRLQKHLPLCYLPLCSGEQSQVLPSL